MRAILQRVERAAVRVASEPARSEPVGAETVGAIGRGLLVLVGVEKGDGRGEVAAMAEKLAGLRVFEDEHGRMNLDVRAAGGDLLIVSQFTLSATLGRGRRPSFDNAAPPEEARPLIDALIAALRAEGLRVATGRFGARMQVELVNDGPVTFVLDVRAGRVVS